MGGNLFKLGRLPRERYLELEAEIRGYLDRTVGAEVYRIPRYYGDKADFGDMDVVLSSDIPGSWDEIRATILSDLGVERHKLIGPVFSTVYRDFQVDYFERPAEIFESTYHFLCFNDLGNLLGKMFRRFNLKYGEDGLFWVFRRENGSYRHDILLSRDHRRIFGFLELDPAPWERGFADLETMFDWVVGSPYFSVEPYFRRAPTTEKRMKQRRTFREFLSFLEDRGVDRRYDYEDDRDRYIPRVAQHFPERDLEAAIARERAAEERALVLQSKFNGRIVMEILPHLQGKELGEFIRRFRAHHDEVDDGVDDQLYRADPEEVRRMIREFADEP